ncbi:hypothetical protein EON81_20715 [bacterium]|nr:MAG: hypothetical protein EON81_20715 [bacterium]
MNSTLAFPRPLPHRGALLLLVSIGLTLASAIGFAPTILRTTSAPRHAEICRCAHCPGAAKCCCGTGARCLP